MLQLSKKTEEESHDTMDGKIGIAPSPFVGVWNLLAATNLLSAPTSSPLHRPLLFLPTSTKLPKRSFLSDSHGIVAVYSPLDVSWHQSTWKDSSRLHRINRSPFRRP